MSAIRDTVTVFTREMEPTRRDPFSLIFTMIQPLVFLGLFGPLLAGVSGMPGGSTWQWFVPGILVMLGLSGTLGTGYNLLQEINTGSHERMLATPMNRSAMLIGRALKEIAPLTVQAALIIAAVVPFGFRLYPSGALTGLLMLAVFGVGLGALSYALAIASKNREWLFFGVQQTLLFPLLILSGMLLPLEVGPAWMLGISRINPLTYVVDAERALFAGNFADPSVLYGTIATIAMAVVGLAIGTRAMRHAS